MQIVFLDSSLEDVYHGRKRSNYHSDLIRTFQKKVNYLYKIKDLMDLREQKSFNLEKLKGSRTGQMSIRLNDQRRLIFKIMDDGYIQVIGIIELSKHYE
ncbi:hypothetical protein BSK20_03620 [SR1 bacterium human oral taxon HOT-345]|nr:hypothetical protein BSK20_03620 [SR1 bacterium human oral taxon HOT-345]